MNAFTLAHLQFEVSGDSALCNEVRALGFTSFQQLAEHVRSLPYGRTADSEDRCAVLHQKRGTCSSKHQLLAAVAQESGHAKIQLVVGIYGMCEENTPGVGTVLRAASTVSIPEAHCYLSVEGDRMDFTGLARGSSSPFAALVAEHVVSPLGLREMKANLHRQALATWASAQGTTAEWAWSVREACIAAIAANHSIEQTTSSQLRVSKARSCS
ncbi:MAG: hypothetical protein IT522_03370 [Burkholderiales bacterium]|nr:hypothetical protein [Burkholderiales bacterium]